MATGGGASVDETLRLAERSGQQGPAGGAYLVVFEPASSFSFSLPTSGEVVVGRGEDVELRLASAAASRRHACLTMIDGEARVKDLGSQNGTWLNDAKLEGEARLSSGDVLVVGEASLVFHGAPRERGREPLAAAALSERALDEIDRTMRHGRPLSLALFLPGAATAEVGSALAASRSLRRSDLVGHQPGGKLLVVLPETEADAAIETTREILASLVRIAPSLKAGISTCPADGYDLEGLLSAAASAASSAPPGGVRAAQLTHRTYQIGPTSVFVADPAMAQLFALVERVAPTDLSALVWGETGTGKELVAQALHHWSRRASKPLAAVSCAALAEGLIDSELFGHVRGAFSGATSTRAGLFEAAEGGTVLLDEVGELSPAAQAKLLRVLETRRVMRLGETRERDVDFRLVCATNRDLEAEVRAGRFRQDLFFRLRGAALWLPPLRDRPRELPLLARKFLEQASAKLGRECPELSPRALLALAEHPWPGNVRELKLLLDYACAVVSEPVLEPWHFEERLGRTLPAEPRPAFRPIDEEVRELERSRMAAALAASSGNQTRAAALIAMPLRTFVTKLKAYGLAGRP